MRGIMRSLVLTACVCHLSAINSQAGEGELVWQIGTRDQSYVEFQHTSDLSAWPRLHPQDVTVAIGAGDPAKAFPALHPGPVDAWAGQKQHPVRITFEMDRVPKAIHVLRIDLADTQESHAPRLRVAVNGEATETKLPTGTGTMTLAHPEKGKPRTLEYVLRPDRLRAGANEIELLVVEGSWLLYDAFALRRLGENEQPAIEATLDPTIFFIEQDGKLLQEFDVHVAGVASDGPVKIEIRRSNGETPVPHRFELDRVRLGIASGNVHVPETDGPRRLDVSVTAGDQSGVVTISQAPQRKWCIYVAPSTHTDIGYTDVQSRVIELHNRNTDLALELADEFPLYHWNLESSWAAQMWLRDRQAYRHERLYEAARNRRVGIESSYLNMLTGLCSGEELIRNLYYSARLHREAGVPFESHTITDAPSHVWTVPTILAGAGIKYVSVGVNQIRAPLLKQNIHHKSPFWWEGPDGSRVLTWFTAGYSQAGQIGLKDGLDRMRVAVGADLYWWDHRDDYPYDAILLHGAYSDNVAIGRDIAESVTAYSRRYAYPKVILAANNDFFEYIEAHFADKIPTVVGCGGSWWEDGAGSTAFETGLNRVTHQDAVAAETLWAVAGGVSDAPGFPAETFRRMWDNVLLFDEHTWGAHNSIADPDSDFVHRQWSVKAAYSTDAADQARRLIDDGLAAIASRVRAADGSLVVFNPSGSPRTGVVEAQIPRGMQIVDDDGPVAQQRVREDVLENVTVAFVAKDVPAVGYRTFGVAAETGRSLPAPKRLEGNVLENDHYRVTLDPKTGGIRSLIDKRLNRELVDSASPYTLGELIYAAGGEEVKGQTQWNCPDPAKVKLSSPTQAQIGAGGAGGVFSSVKSRVVLPPVRGMEMETILYEQEPRVDFVFRMDKQMEYAKEAVYLAFPFAGAKPQFRYEIAAGSVRPNEDHFPGACRDWFSVQRWVTVNTDEGGVAWSAVDTPLITLCAMTPGRWLDQLEISNGTIFAYVMNNYWFTNYKAGQDGRFTFRFSVTSGQTMDPAAATAFGESVHQPMRAVRLHPGRTGQAWPAARSFCRVEPETVSIMTFKRADDGAGLILRLRETAGRATRVGLTIDVPGAASAARCDLIERVQGPLAMAGGRIELDLGANALATVRLTGAPPEPSR